MIYCLCTICNFWLVIIQPLSAQLKKAYRNVNKNVFIIFIICSNLFYKGKSYAKFASLLATNYLQCFTDLNHSFGTKHMLFYF